MTDPAWGFADELVVRDALAHRFRLAGMPDGGGYDEPFFEIHLGPVTFTLPSTPQRADAARRHDLHHVVTEYGQDVRGEAELAAWELASGCTSYPSAWALNVTALPLGMALAPRQTVAAFARGRRTRNAYTELADVDDVMDDDVGQTRHRLGLDGATPEEPTPGDAVTVAAYAAIGLSLAPALASVGLALSLLRRVSRRAAR